LKFLGRAKKFLRGMAEPPKARVQYFNVQCPSGHRVRGERTLGYQALRCPGCGEGIFVLPVSPLPEPAVPTRSSSPKPRTSRTSVVDDEPIPLNDIPSSSQYTPTSHLDRIDADIIWEETAEEATQTEPSSLDIAARSGKPDLSERAASTPKRPKSGPKPEQLDSSSAARRSTPVGRTAVRSDSRPVQVGIEIRRPNRSRRPLLIFLSVALLALATLGFRAWRSRRLELPTIYDQGRTEGLAALDAGRFDKAHQLLSAASQAVNSLGGGLEGAEEVRQAANEAAIFVDLLPEPLEVMLNEAGPLDPQGWESRFNAFYYGHSIVIDARIESIPSSNGGSGYSIDYVIFPPGEATLFRENGPPLAERWGRIDFSDFELFQLAQPKVGDHVIFGAKLASFALDRTTGTWVVRFKPKSGVFITHVKALESLGWPSESAFSEKAGDEE